ncbi:hypothetical protein SDC9_12913 [bioreactor metagenome]|uniref:Uncharacterized protein n=1 Tax=bioreactor metagenome TaxID=1076179 RepID=A0A644TLL5_9ZZZZ
MRHPLHAAADMDGAGQLVSRGKSRSFGEAEDRVMHPHVVENHRPDLFPQERLIHEPVVVISLGAEKIVANVGQDPRGAAPHAGKDQFVMEDMVAHHVEPLARPEPVRNRKKLLRIQPRIRIATDEDVHPRVVRHEEAPHRTEPGKIGVVHHHDLGAIGLQRLDRVGGHAAVAIEPRGPAQIQVLGNLRVDDRPGHIFRPVPPEREGDDVALGMLWVEAAPAGLQTGLGEGALARAVQRVPVLVAQVCQPLAAGVFLMAGAAEAGDVGVPGRDVLAQLQRHAQRRDRRLVFAALLEEQPERDMAIEIGGVMERIMLEGATRRQVISRIAQAVGHEQASISVGIAFRRDAIDLCGIEETALGTQIPRHPADLFDRRIAAGSGCGLRGRLEDGLFGHAGHCHSGGHLNEYAQKRRPPDAAGRGGLAAAVSASGPRCRVDQRPKAARIVVFRRMQPVGKGRPRQRRAQRRVADRHSLGAEIVILDRGGQQQQRHVRNRPAQEQALLDHLADIADRAFIDEAEVDPVHAPAQPPLGGALEIGEHQIAAHPPHPVVHATGDVAGLAEEQRQPPGTIGRDIAQTRDLALSPAPIEQRRAGLPRLAPGNSGVSVDHSIRIFEHLMPHLTECPHSDTDQEGVD